MGNWSELSNDILGLIVDQFSAIEDIVHFGAVCRPWLAVSVEKWHFCIANPWLMLAEKEDSDIRGFYNLSTKKVYYLNLPEARGRNCWSSCGWLITLGLDLKIHILNPFSRVQIPLPPQPTLPDQYTTERTAEDIRQFFIKKVILSSRPSLLTPCEDDDEKCVVMVLLANYNKLAFLRMGDEVWTPVDGPGCISDVVCFSGQFYAITYQGKLLTVNISNPHPKTIEIAERAEDINGVYYYYLVESAGELFMLLREIIMEKKSEELFDYTHETNGFDVYKFNFDNKKWTQMKSLDNCAMFVGDNASFAFFPSKNLAGCKSNCIYFTDDDAVNLDEGKADDMGVFLMETNEVDDHYDGPDIISYICPPIWISPP